MPVEITYTYVAGSRTNGTRTHAQSRGDLIRGLAAVQNWLRNGWGYDIRFRHVSAGGSITMSFGLNELHMGGNTYAREMVRSDRPRHVYHLGNLPGRPSMFATPIQLGLFSWHGIAHVNKVKANPRADKHGHSAYGGDWFSIDCGQRFRDQSIHGWLKRYAGKIPGWKPKAKAIDEAESTDMLAMVSGQDSGFEIVPCGCMAGG